MLKTAHNKALYLTSITLRSIAAGELGRWAKKEWKTKKGKVMETFIYTISEDNIIVNYSKNFLLFARRNDWSSEIEPEKTIGHSIFEFISGIEVRHLYEILFQHCRRKGNIGPIPFRCDSPTEKRFLELYLRSLPGGYIDIITQLIKTEPRSSVDLLKTNVPRSEKLITICSMCKKIKVSEDEWLEIEEAIARLRIFDLGPYPQLTHGLCKSCYLSAVSQLNEE